MSLELPFRALAVGAFLAVKSSFAADAIKPAHDAGTDPVFALGTVTVFGAMPEAADEVPVKVEASTVDLLEKKNLSAALAQLPGVTLTNFGGRNETAVYVRGFARNQTPLFIDGVPVYVPYDGIIDLGRFTTYDVAAISVAKGYSSALYGPNTMGGVINILTRQPTQPFEGGLMAGAFSGSGWESALNFGGRQKRWYYQAGASYVAQDYYPLSSHFTPVAAESGGHRGNSYRTDWKISGKIAYTPNATDEYAVGFIHQDGDKGNPPQTNAPRYWRWPQWNKQTIYAISHTRLGDASYFKPRFYYDTYDNTLRMFDDATYTTENKSSSGTSIYHDYSYGGSVEAGTTSLAHNFLKGVIHYKFDHHREFPDYTRKPTAAFVDEDEGISYGFEDTVHFAPRWEGQVGLSYDVRDTKKALDTATGLPFPTGDFSSFNPEAGVFYKLSDAGALHLTVAHKSRFPSMKERYSYRMGQGIPNINLNAETALHYELGYVGRLEKGLSVNASVFNSRVDDTIQQVFLSPLSTIGQFQNIGSSDKRGADVGFDWAADPQATLGASFSCLYQKTFTVLAKNTEPVKGTDTPRQSGNLHADLRPFKWLSVVPAIEYSSWRYSFSDGKGTTRTVGGFTLANLKFTVRLPHEVALGAGVDNLFDKNHQLQEGFPEAGRTWFANVRYHF